jgi:hypothetical protein
MHALGWFIFLGGIAVAVSGYKSLAPKRRSRRDPTISEIEPPLHKFPFLVRSASGETIGYVERRDLGPLLPGHFQFVGVLGRPDAPNAEKYEFPARYSRQASTGDVLEGHRSKRAGKFEEHIALTIRRAYV